MQRTPVSTAPEAPPIVAPPVVEPPRAGVTHRSQDVSISDGPSPVSSLLHRVSRDIQLGGVCLIIGLVVGQSSWLSRDRAVRIEPEVSSVADSRQAMNDQTFTLGGDLYPSARVKSAAEVELPQRHVDKESQPLTTTLPSGLPASAASSLVEISTDASANRSSDAIKREPFVDSSSNAPPSLSKAAALPNRIGPVQPTRDKPEAPPSIERLTTFDLARPAAGPQCEDGTCQQNMESHGTVLKWADTPADAYRMAGEQNKLVFLIHVSGNFEIPGFT